MTNEARQAAAKNLHMHEEGTAYGEHLAEQIIWQFKDAPKTAGIEQRILTLGRRNRRADYA
jgi:hypothetical protein